MVIQSLSYERGKLTIEVEDNGHGFDLDTAEQNGLLNIGERAKKIGCELVIKSEKTGTKITFYGSF